MKAEVYVVLERGRAQLLWTVAPEIDKAYWLEPDFREEAARYASAARTASADRSAVRAGAIAYEPLPSRLRRCLFWSEPLPLGQAAGLAERWPRSPGGGWDERSAAEQLARMVREDMEENGRKRRGGLLRRSGWRLPVLRPERRDRSRQPAGMPLDRPRQPAGHVRLHAANGGPIGIADARRLTAQACRLAELCRGRALLSGEAQALFAAAGVDGADAAAPALQLAALLGRLRIGPAIAPLPAPRFAWLRRLAPPGTRPRRANLRCLRCGSGEAHMRRTRCAACGRMCAYCEACLGMGRSRECGLLILGTPTTAPPRGAAAAPPAERAGTPPIAARLAPWKLSPAQAAAAAEALRYIERDDMRILRSRQRFRPPGPLGRRRPGCATAAGDPGFGSPRIGEPLSPFNRLPAPAAPIGPFLLWAVTGAGKTEMIFPLIESVRMRGERVLVATPRRDVVLELDPRLRRAFPHEKIVTLYGGSPQRWEDGDIVLATTHQLFRFQHAFELVVIDELDAFPYHNDPLLHYAAAKVCKPGGRTVLLSATPPAGLQRAARRGKLPHAKVPARFHRHPLPVPATIRTPPVGRLIRQRQLPARLAAAIRASLDRGAQLFLFVQQIRHIDPLVGLLRQTFPDAAIDGTSSKDTKRAEKVRLFRECAIRLLVTTTILERGVTVPRSDVFILDADGRLFDEASLVQMAGRAGRSQDDPAGRVYFCAPERNRAQRLAIRHITGMNKLAKRQGYLNDGNGSGEGR
ncbi:helicase-related protein [Paenibacillus sp. 32O-W]|uniref:helicase-related protein n=1 Tax=Paenibacillus sp. 32O-W TaxID=1695218 RepID=UPI0007851528|nr:helicase-related protein [Paenibacillus sp. 32O-W]